jgi:hypothetical protein
MRPTDGVFSRDPGSSSARGQWVEVGVCRSRRLITRASLVGLGGRRGDPREVDTFELTVCCVCVCVCVCVCARVYVMVASRIVL